MVFLFSLNLGFCEGFFDKNGEFNYYVSNGVPTVDFTIKFAKENVIVKDARLFVGADVFLQDFDDIEVAAGEKDFKKSFPLSSFERFTKIDGNSEVFFEINVVKKETGSKIKSTGDPTRFKIIFDDKKPELLGFDGKEIKDIEVENSIRAVFDEKIALFKIFNEKFNFKKPVAFNPTEAGYGNVIEFKFPANLLNDGENVFNVVAEDFAGNVLETEAKFYVEGEPLNFELVTKREDSNLKYFYDKNFKNFFNGTVFYSDAEFDLVLKTNKPAQCFFSSSFTSFVEFENLLEGANIKDFESSDGITHKIKMNGEKKVWVACQDKYFESSIVYLSEVLGIGKNLIKFKKHTGNFEIEDFFPQVIVSSVPFDVEVVTSQESICKFKVSSGIDMFFTDNVDYKRHFERSLSLGDGKYDFEVECFDRLYNVKKLNRNVEINSKLGPSLIEPKIAYVDNTATKLSLKLSEDASCKVSSKQISPDEFSGLKNLTGTGIERSFTPTKLEKGDNDFYLFCEKDGQLFSSSFKVVFDSAPPKISGLKFVAGDYESDYLRDDSRLEFKLNYSSLIPYDHFVAELILENSSKYENFSRKSGSMKEDLDEAKRFKIVAVNVLGKKSNYLEKQIKFDFDKPILAFVNMVTERKITCIDSQSGCGEIFYGFGDSTIACNANVKYNDSAIAINDNRVICAMAFDLVGNQNKISESLRDYFSGGGDKNESKINESDSETSPEENQTTKPPVTDNPFEPNTNTGVDQGGNNGLVIAAIVLVLLGGMSGGGYYAYREGYLDKQLEKFGIYRNKGGVGSGVSGVSQPGVSNGSRVGDSVKKVTKSLVGKAGKKSKYDRNLKKLHSFIDDTLSKDDDVFDSFDSVGKGDVEGYEDTLLKKKGSTKKKKKKKYQEFSANKNFGKGNLKDENSIEKEAEEFEEYFKKKAKKENKKE